MFDLTEEECENRKRIYKRDTKLIEQLNEIFMVDELIKLPFIDLRCLKSSISPSPSLSLS